jgi:hypothetical protein
MKIKSPVLKRIFAAESEEVKGVWRKIYNMELYNLYSSPDLINIINQGG